MNRSHLNNDLGTLFTTAAALIGPAEGQIVNRSSYGAIGPLATRPALGAWIDRATASVVRWGARRAQRRALGQLDERLLADIGLDRLDAAAEAHKPFWRA